jgi:hypothetical protein
MVSAPIACPVCGHADMVIKVTSPQAPRVLPITDAEIAQAAQQLSPDPPPTPPPTPARRSGCLVAVLVTLGITIFFGAAIYSGHWAHCERGSLVSDKPIIELPWVSTKTQCIDGEVITAPEVEYAFPGGQYANIVQYGACGLFLLGIILPTIWWFQGRAERAEWSAYRAELNHRAQRQSVPSPKVVEARARVDAAYYCGRDDGFFFPGHTQFYPRAQWSSFLFG